MSYLLFGKLVKNETERIHQKRSYPIVKSNILVQQSKFELSLFEQKILIYIFAQIKPNDTELKRYKISIKEFCKISGIDYKNGGNYVYIKKAIEKMAQRFIWITIEEEGKEVETMLRIIEKPFISKQSGTIEIKLDDMMKEHLIFLKEKGKFTIYDGIYSLPMTSKYSMRIYEILKSYANQKIVRANVKKLKETLMIGKKSYTAWSDFRKRILLPALNEINRFSDISVNFTTTRKGRSIEYITFSIRQKNIDDTINTFDKNNKILDGEIEEIEYE